MEVVLGLRGGGRGDLHVREELKKYQSRGRRKERGSEEKKNGTNLALESNGMNSLLRLLLLSLSTRIKHNRCSRRPTLLRQFPDPPLTRFPHFLLCISSASSTRKEARLVLYDGRIRGVGTEELLCGGEGQGGLGLFNEGGAEGGSGGRRGVAGIGDRFRLRWR